MAKTKTTGSIDLSPNKAKLDMLVAQRKAEGLSIQIRNEIDRLEHVSNQISEAYSNYAESDNRIDDPESIHLGLANMLKLIEYQNVVKLKVKRMQMLMMKLLADSASSAELPYIIADIVKDINVGFLDSKLVRAYGEIAKVMKEDSVMAKDLANNMHFDSPKELTMDLEVDGDDVIDINDVVTGDLNEDEDDVHDEHDEYESDGYGDIDDELEDYDGDI